MPGKANRKRAGSHAFLQGYVPSEGVPDELFDFGGEMRPGWSGLIEHLASQKADQLERSFARGRQYLRDAGVFFRQYGAGDQGVRDWPLSPVPVVLTDMEWAEISAGLIQRADLLEAVAADIYGDNSLVAQGRIPAGLVAGNPEWLRPMVGVRPASGHFLHFVAFEIGRRPDGRWWVLGDRTQAPSGAGYALENRVASMRSFSGYYRNANVVRLASFFRAFRDGLNALKQDPSGRVGILSPGPMTDTYYEHAYIARYLGMMLLEGEDLTVESGRLMVRTVSGLQPVSVLWRRLDSVWVDPLELDESSRLGTPGLLTAVRNGNVTMINALGTGVLESRAFLAFLPRLSEVLLGAPLRMPNVATWWCGGADERAHVAGHADRMMIGPANSIRLPLEPGEDTALGGAAAQRKGRDVAAWLEAEGDRLIGQDQVTLSTTPAWFEGRLVPRPMSIRVFLARTEDGWQVMPGGYARLAAEQDPSAVSIRQGGSVADVWVVSDKPVAADTMLHHSTETFVRSLPGILPSRAADNLFWLGRYVERAEGTMRLVRAYNGRIDETPAGGSPLMDSLKEFLEDRDVDVEEGLPRHLVRTLSSAVNSASHIRDRFSVDAWASLTDLQRTLAKMSPKVVPGDDAAAAMGVLLRKITGFSGLVNDNMYRFTGWRFLTLGRSIERALAMASLLSVFADRDAREGGFDLCVEVGDSVMSHRRRYSVTTSRETVIDLLALDHLNPRSIAYHVDEIRNQISLLPGAEVNGQLSGLSRSALKLYSDLTLHTPQTLDGEALGRILQDIYTLTGDVAGTYLS
ncbi:putative circularly permuted ATP-grasp superfamily protein [Hoeflea marina]|uniref:Putative circularly permuted ATP-grasp superfamily protein n=1 Tax=Hoeflea marina TaxID=274592 RepID=A0A317PL42_9HYPH|nr:circularly permuted type 2 ATP-grasp protein [Hoeflea marina]PWW01665.1 putative circularly permuted ATP-grasp superfamily protein [Hoeflea marina]